jgi:hypothetical protein
MSDIWMVTGEANVRVRVMDAFLRIGIVHIPGVPVLISTVTADVPGLGLGTVQTTVCSMPHPSS